MKKEYELKNRINEYCRQKELLFQGARIVLGLSGGADSVCLFLVLLSLAEEWELTLFPVHVNHNIRGEEAERDRRFCEELCRQHNIELKVVSVPVPKLAEENGWTLEEAGRNARYQTFAELQKNLGCDRIAVAHHKNDQAETVLFQLFRGSRLKGLAGMEPRNGSIIRPLLAVTREEIEEYLSEKQQKYCIDRTNFEEEYTRNRIRHRLLPAAQELQPRAVEHVAETADYLGRVEQLLDRLTEELYRQTVMEDGSGGIKLAIEPLEAAENLLTERVIYRALCRASGGKKDITAGFVADCMELMKKQTGRRISLPGGLTAKKRYGELWIGTVAEEPECFYEEIHSFPFEVRLHDGEGTLILRRFNRADNPEEFEEKLRSIPKSTYTKWFDYDKIEKVISLKTPAPEDVIILYTDGRGKKALDVLKEAKVPEEERKKRRILTAGNRVLWIPGIRGSEAYHVTKETRCILEATIDGGKKDGR